MSDEVIYKRKLCESEDVAAPDNLVQNNVEVQTIYVAGPGEYKRGELLMSDSNHQFTKATESGISGADELCILSEDLNIDEDTVQITTGYFFGEYDKASLILPEDMIIDAAVESKLRKHGIYVK